jgi:small subunit ribosomal protein S7
LSGSDGSNRRPNTRPGDAGERRRSGTPSARRSFRWAARRFTKAEIQLKPDPRYGDKDPGSRFINCVMYDGKKAVAQRVVYDAFDIIEQEAPEGNLPRTSPQEPLELFQMAIENVKPFVEVRSKRIGGANYQVPMQVNRTRQQSLAFRWILDATRSEKGRPMAQRWPTSSTTRPAARARP